MEGKYEKETYIALNPFLVRNRIFTKTKRNYFLFLAFFFTRQQKLFPKRLMDMNRWLLSTQTNVSGKITSMKFYLPATLEKLR